MKRRRASKVQSPPSMPRRWPLPGRNRSRRSPSGPSGRRRGGRSMAVFRTSLLPATWTSPSTRPVAVPSLGASRPSVPLSGPTAGFPDIPRVGTPSRSLPEKLAAKARVQTRTRTTRNGSTTATTFCKRVPQNSFPSRQFLVPLPPRSASRPFRDSTIPFGNSSCTTATRSWRRTMTGAKKLALPIPTDCPTFWDRRPLLA
mmetsp:Transcript_21625/g.51240  ORF Transcript_21625/g.51240 Transcript_21625/m.51240 type:complete len:201 (-) Transcript_21625:5780-6382(-)